MLAGWLALGAGGCGSSDTAPAAAPVDAGALAPSADVDGPNPVGHATFDVTDAARSRALRVTVWYPADAAGAAAATAGTPLEDLEPPGAHHDALAALVAAAKPACTRKRTRSAPDLAPAAGPWPVLVFSHCHGCARFSEAVVAERLASHGFAVVAPDHTGDTMYDATLAPLDDTFLATRAADLRFVLDLALDASSTALPAALRGKFDAGRAGVFGHSYGAITTGLALRDDARLKAGLSIAAPMAGLLGPAQMSDLHVPVALLLASEDNSVPKIVGNDVMEKDFTEAASPAYIARVADAGHFSFSDLCGLTAQDQAGCGEGKRMDAPHDAFSYVAADTSRAFAQRWVTAFFRASLLGDDAARASLGSDLPAGVTASTK